MFFMAFHSREDHIKHLGVYLDTRLNLSKYIRDAVIKGYQPTKILKSKYVSRKVLDLSYKLYARLLLDISQPKG